MSLYKKHNNLVNTAIRSHIEHMSTSNRANHRPNRTDQQTYALTNERDQDQHSQPPASDKEGRHHNNGTLKKRILGTDLLH